MGLTHGLLHLVHWDLLMLLATLRRPLPLVSLIVLALVATTVTLVIAASTSSAIVAALIVVVVSTLTSSAALIVIVALLLTAFLLSRSLRLHDHLLLTLHHGIGS
jgi:hypothetical protein